MDVTIDSRSVNPGDIHRALWLAREMKQARKWDGEGKLIFKSPKIVNDDVRETQLTGKLRITEDNVQKGQNQWQDKNSPTACPNSG